MALRKEFKELEVKKYCVIQLFFTMLIKHHVIITSIVGASLFFLNLYSYKELLLFLLGGIIIDIDHIPSYWYYTKDLSCSYKKIKQWCIGIGYLMEHYFLFHTIWFVLLVISMVYFFQSGMPFFYGLMLHILLDIYCDIYWYCIKKKNVRPYRRWVAPLSLLKKINCEKYL